MPARTARSRNSSSRRNASSASGTKPRRPGSTSRSCPGILPVSNVATTRRFAQTCGAAIPHWLDGLFEGLDDLPAARQLIAATVAAELCGQLYAGGVRHFHFYTLNRAELSYAICHLARSPGESMSAAQDPSRRSGQAHPDQGRRLRHADPGAAPAERRLLRRPRPDEGPARQQRPAQPDQARAGALDLRALRRGGRRRARHQHLQRQRDQPGRLRRRSAGRPDQPQPRPRSSAKSPTAIPRRTASRAGSPARSGRPTRPCRCRPTSTIPASAKSISTRSRRSIASRSTRWSRAASISS